MVKNKLILIYSETLLYIEVQGTIIINSITYLRFEISKIFMLQSKNGKANHGSPSINRLLMV